MRLPPPARPPRAPTLSPWWGLRHGARRGVARLAAVVSLLLALTWLTGCVALPGTDDVALTYRAVGGEDVRGEPLRAAVLARLAAARLAATVSVDDAVVRIVVSRDAEVAVQELLRWTGGASFHHEAPLAAPVVGKPDEVNAAVRAAPVGAATVLYEPLGPELARTRAVARKPIASARGRDLAVRVSADGRGLALAPPPAVAAALGGASDAAAAPIWVVRDDTVLGVVRADAAGAVTVNVGEGVYAYTRAARLRDLLASPDLPAFEPMGSVRQRPDYVVAALGLLLPFLLSIGWLAFVRRFDRLHPEPRWLVGLVFALGVASVVPTAVIEVAWMRLGILFNPAYSTLGGRLAAFPLALLVFTVVVGLTEEAMKLLATLIVVRRREFDEPIDGIVYGVAAALGFAAAENVKYFATGRLAPSLVVARTFTSIPAHLFLAALWGYALGQTLVPGHRRHIVLRALALAAVLHGAFDALLSTRGLALLALVLNLGLASVFVVLVRQSLRRAAAGADAPPLSVERSTVVETGSTFAFRAAAVLVHLAAVALVALGASLESSGARPGATFAVLATLALSALFGSAWVLSATLPLDLVLDASGITFAGSMRPWDSLTGVSRSKLGPFHYVAVASTAGELRIGPLPAATADTLSRRLRSAAEA